MKWFLMLTSLALGMSVLLEGRPIYRSPRLAHSAQPEWDDKLDLQEIEDRLAAEEVVHTQRIQHYLEKTGKISKASHNMLLVELESGLKAVFKPGHYIYAEVAAYRANKALGQRLVPPTVFRTIDGKLGSLQFLVETKIDLKKSHGTELFRKVSPKDISDMKLFYFVFGQWDAHAGNQLINTHNGKAHLALIDNAGIFHRSYANYGDYFFIEQGSNDHGRTLCPYEFPFEEAKTVHPKSMSQLKNIFGAYLPNDVLRKILAHHSPITYCIWCKALWIQKNKHSHTVKPSVTKQFFDSTIKAYQKLDRTTLEKVWAEYIEVNEPHARELISLTLKRRDQVLDAAT